MRYCRRCVLPDTRPSLTIGQDGVCNACAAHGTKPAIDWLAREAAFRAVVERAKGRRATYDCVIPVSGGKDSTWQVVTCLEHGLRPLAVTWRPPKRTPLGQKNLQNLIDLGVDHIDFSVNPRVEKRFFRKALERHGSTAIPMHLALFNIPRTVAVRFGIPLVVWGENSAFEYGGPEEERQGFQMDSAWLARYGVTNGTTANDWVDDELPLEQLTPYAGPTDAALRQADVLSVFLGYYFAWDPAKTFDVARRHGFEARSEGPKTGYYNYADIDDEFISLHHFLKWYKFGFTRLWDNLSLEIRNGRLTREQAMAIIRKRGDETPRDDIEAFCRYVGMTRREFFEVAERFRNPAIWTRRDGVWQIDGFLIREWDWHGRAAERSAACV